MEPLYYAAMMMMIVLLLFLMMTMVMKIMTIIVDIPISCIQPHLSTTTSKQTHIYKTESWAIFKSFIIIIIVATMQAKALSQAYVHGKSCIPSIY